MSSGCCPATGRSSATTAKLLDSTIARLTQYQHMADFGTCAVDWPLLDEWDAELAKGVGPE